MLKISLTAITCIIFIISIFFLLRSRRKYAITGFKTLLTPICFYMIGILGAIGLWTHSFGLFLWILIVSFLLLAAYFTKYLPKIHHQN